MPGKLRVAVVGAGRYAGQYHIPHLAANPGVELAALCSTNPDDLARKARQFGVPVTDEDYRRLLDRAPLDALVVSSPHALHYEHCKAGLERGLHVLVDKHPVLRLAEWQELTALAAAKGLVLMPAFNRHLDPANRYARQLIQSGALSDAYYAHSLQVGYTTSGWYTSVALAGGGPLVGRGSHMAALLPWLTGWRPAAVTALLTSSGMDVDAGGIVNVHATTGGLFQIAAVRTGYRNVDEVEVVGTGGAVRVERLAGQGWIVTHRGPAGEVVPLAALPPGQTTTDHFVDVILGRTANCLPPEDGLAGVEIIEAAYASARTGQTVAMRKGGGGGGASGMPCHRTGD